jgi:hypothetical protein
MVRVAVYNLLQRELEDEEKVNAVARAVIGAILSVPQTGLSEGDISFTFPRVFLGKRETVSVIISEESLESFFQRGMNFEVRQSLCRRVNVALKPILRKEGRNISVEIG